MGDRRPRLAPVAKPLTGELTASGTPNSPLVAAGPNMGSGAINANEAYNQYLNFGWQLQAWAYYHAIGPFNYGVNWRAAALSRVSLVIAELMPGQQEPNPVEDDQAKEAVAILDQLKWGESRIMKRLALQLDVPGRGYLVGRDVPNPADVGGRLRDWQVYSPQQVRPVPANKKRNKLGYEYELWEWGGEWTPLDNALVSVIREPDPCYSWLDVSNAQAALATLREIDLLNKEIISTLVSRIANNGILLVPSEVSFPTRENYNDNDDPFMLELIEVARQSIKDPGSASAAIPMPIKVPSQFIDKFRHLIVSQGVDEKVFKARDDAYEILAETLNLPKELMTGMADVNHSAGLSVDLTNDAIALHISPTAEVIAGCLTEGFLYPQMIANRFKLTGPNGGKLVIWYDTAALAAKPDLSEPAKELYDRLEVKGETLRRESGFTEDDAPDKPELRDMILKKAVAQQALLLTALTELTGTEVQRPAAATSNIPNNDPAASQDEDPQDGGVQADTEADAQRAADEATA